MKSYRHPSECPCRAHVKYKHRGVGGEVGDIWNKTVFFLRHALLDVDLGLLLEE